MTNSRDLARDRSILVRQDSWIFQKRTPQAVQDPRDLQQTLARRVACLRLRYGLRSNFLRFEAGPFQFLGQTEEGRVSVPLGRLPPTLLGRDDSCLEDQWGSIMQDAQSG